MHSGLHVGRQKLHDQWVQARKPQAEGIKKGGALNY